MSLREAFEQSQLLTVVVLAAIAWLLFSVGRVLSQFDFWAGESVGMTADAGVVGVLVMGITLVFAAALLGAFGHDEPAPEAWPPEDA